MKIALPRALHDHYFFPCWKTFLEGIGHDVVRTPGTSRSILDCGVNACLSDLCLPVKAYMGHVAAAATLGDAVFVPRLVSREKTRYYCPKFLALPDLVRAKFPRLRLLTVEINAKKGPDFTRKSYVRLARGLGATKARAMSALAAGETALSDHRRARQERFREEVASGDGALRIALIGHPYCIDDACLSSGIRDWLTDRGASVFRYDSVPDEDLSRTDTGLYRSLYWECSHSLMRAAVHCLTRPGVDGTVFVSAFGCGPDSFVGDLVGRRARALGVAPFVRLLIDEHTARTGLVTRLEAFLDMVRAFRERRSR